MIFPAIWSRLAAIVVSYLALPESAASSRNASLSQIEPFVQDLVDRYHIPGLAVAVVRQDTEGGDKFENYQAHFGTATTDGKVVDGDSLFAIASNSKLFTYFAIGLLIENGTRLADGRHFGWDTKIKDVVPGWDMQDKWARDHVDITDLLAHRCGLPRHDHAHSARDTPADVANSFVHFKPSYEPRQQWQYNNQGYIALAYIVSVLSGKPLHEYVTEHILSPLGMTSTTYNATSAGETGYRTNGYIRSGINETECKEWWTSGSSASPARGHRAIHPSCLGSARGMDWWTDTDGLFEAGAGGIITSSTDMLKWLNELLHPTVLPASMFRRASTALEIVKGDFASSTSGIIGYGLAQMAWTYRGINLLGHTGSVPGQRTNLVRIPEHNTAVMVWTNDDTLGVPLLKIVAYKVVEIVAGLSTIDAEGEEMRAFLSLLPKYVDLPEDPTPPTPEDDVLGTYFDGGYGSFTLARLQPNNGSQAALLGGAGVQYVPLNTTGPVYVAPMDKVFLSHLVFTHFSGELFNWTAVALWPELGEDKEPTGEWLTDLGGSGSAIIDGHGVGLYGNFWGAEGDAGKGYAQEAWSSDRRRKEANVWFAKVKSAL